MSRLTRRHPTLAAAALYALVIALVFWPAWTGQMLISPWSDQNAGYPFRLFAAQYFKSYHNFPGWTPYIFGGMPFAANPTFGDTFYPDFVLRLILPVGTGITFGMLLHLFLAGIFTYVFLREVKLEWGAAFVGGAAYMLTGQVASLVTAGHDGKIIVSAMLPLGLLFLYQAVTRGDWRRYLWFGVVVGLSLLSPHVQMTYYELMADGFFWLFLVAWSGERPAGHRWWQSGLLFVGALILGFALDGVQLIPFTQYIGFSPRGAAGSSSSGWAYATSFSMPPEELLNVIWPSFSGSTLQQSYWGRNGLKLHSEYLGVATLMLASLAAFSKDKRRLAWFFVFLGGYGLLFALGRYTPFYRIPYALLPGIKLTRAPSQIFFLVSFSVAVFAAFGTQALLRSGDGLRLTKPAIGVGLLLLGMIIAVAGGWKGIMLSFTDPQHARVVEAHYSTFVRDTVRALVLGVLLTVAILAGVRGKLRGDLWAVVLGLIVLLDLWSGERRQFLFGPPASRLFAEDAVVRELRRDSTLYRVLPAAGYVSSSDANYLMIYRLRSVLGYQGTELHRYDELLGGKNLWNNLFNLNIWRVLAVKYVMAPSPAEFAGLSLVGKGPLTTYGGEKVYLYRYDRAQPYAYLTADALKASDEQVLPTLLDPRFDPRRLLLVAPDSPQGSSNLTTLPAAIETPVHVVEPRVGALEFTLDSALAAPSYLFVSENYYPAWHARVDGRPVPVLRAQLSLMAIPMAAGARSVELVFSSARYVIGGAVTLAALAGVIAVAIFTALRHRRAEEQRA